MRVESQDMHIAFTGVTTITVPDAKSAKRLINRLVAQGYWFHFFRRNDVVYLTFSDKVDLGHFRERLPGVQFTV